MDGFLSPSVEQVLPLLAQTCDELTKQALIRELTTHTEDLCKGDPDLADTILEGKKTLQGCVRYVTEQAAKVVLKNVEAMTDAEFNALGKKQVRGKQAAMAGGMIGSEQALQWANDYYYKAPPERVAMTTATAAKKEVKKKQAPKKPDSATKPTPTASAEKLQFPASADSGEQITMAGFGSGKAA